jgi:uncharacterized protein YqgV (UPF0045/DUF77 family)
VKLSAQISVYPLRQNELHPAVNAVRDALAARGFEPSVGAMSTVISGDAAMVFSGLQDAFEAAAATGDTVLAITISNACPT